MAHNTIAIHNLDNDLQQTLQRRAATHGRSVEEEARAILWEVLRTTRDQGPNLAERLRQRFEPLGGLELPEPMREPLAVPPDFSDDHS